VVEEEGRAGGGGGASLHSISPRALRMMARSLLFERVLFLVWVVWMLAALSFFLGILLTDDEDDAP
jgi:hypothetical protein